MGGDCFEFGFSTAPGRLLGVSPKEEFRQHFADMLAAGA
jgi:hypothetical protein